MRAIIINIKQYVELILLNKKINTTFNWDSQLYEEYYRIVSSYVNNIEINKSDIIDEYNDINYNMKTLTNGVLLSHNNNNDWLSVFINTIDYIKKDKLGKPQLTFNIEPDKPIMEELTRLLNVNSIFYNSYKNYNSRNTLQKNEFNHILGIMNLYNDYTFFSTFQKETIITIIDPETGEIFDLYDLLGK